ncbi:hypothetical protein FNAPI_9382 [Fusarium napiforme]|uniref:Uncharacterized protein n=1 Tax=Fusarium napiforme TaxID=42672 RepID=A0A8H5MW43_9HYPO|nr:hypothetical protein FNAPI_9382 [Fusarium napiforme]
MNEQPSLLPVYFTVSPRPRNSLILGLAKSKLQIIHKQLRIFRDPLELYQSSPSQTAPKTSKMCEQVRTIRRCTTCQQNKSEIIRNINCDKVSIYKLGLCRNGMSYRDVTEPIECSECHNKRVREVEAERRRRWLEAWPEDEPEVENEKKDDEKEEKEKQDDGASVATDDATVNSEESWNVV